MADEKKTIVLGWKVDNTGFQLVKARLQELKNELRELVSMSAKFGNGLIGAGAKGVGAGPGSSQGPSSVGSSQINVAGSGVVGAMTQTVTATGNMLKGVSGSVKMAMEAMQKDSRRLVQTQIADLKALETQGAKTAAIFTGRLGGLVGNRSFTQTSYGAAGSGPYPALSAAGSGGGASYGDLSRNNSVARGSGFGGWSHGWSGQAASQNSAFSWDNGSTPRTVGGGGWVGPGGNGWEEIGLRQGTAAASPFRGKQNWAGAAAIGAGAGMAIADYWSNQPFQDSRMLANSAQAFGGIGMQQRHLTSQGAQLYMATKSLVGNQDYEQAVRDAAAATLTRDMTLGGVGKLVAGAGGAIIGGLTGNAGALGGFDMNEFANKQSQVPLEFLKNAAASNPMMGAATDLMFGSFGGGQKMMKALGVGGSFNGKTWNTPLQDMEARLNAQGLTSGDALAGQSAVEGAGGFHFAQGVRENAMHFQLGHLNSAGSVLAAAGQMGANGKDASHILRQLSGTGFDPGAASSIGDYVAQQAFSGAKFDMATAFGSFGTPGGSSAEQMRSVQGRISNFQDLSGGVFGGGRDNYQKALNMKLALDATGGNSALARVLSTDPKAMDAYRDAVAGKGVTNDSFRALGATPEMLKSYGEGVMSSRFRIAGAYLLGNEKASQSESGLLYRQMLTSEAGSDISKFAHQQGIVGAHGEILDKKRFSAIRSGFAGIMRSEYSGEKAMSERDAMEAFNSALGLSTPRSLKERGSEEAGGKSFDASVDKARSKSTKEELALGKTITNTDVANIPKMGGAMVDLATHLNKTVGDVDLVLQKFGTEVGKVTTILQELNINFLTKGKKKVSPPKEDK